MRDIVDLRLVVRRLKYSYLCLPKHSYEGVDLPAPSKGWFHDRYTLVVLYIIYD